MLIFNVRSLDNSRFQPVSCLQYGDVACQDHRPFEGTEKGQTWALGGCASCAVAQGVEHGTPCLVSWSATPVLKFLPVLSFNFYFASEV